MMIFCTVIVFIFGEYSWFYLNSNISFPEVSFLGGRWRLLYLALRPGHPVPSREREIAHWDIIPLIDLEEVRAWSVEKWQDWPTPSWPVLCFRTVKDILIILRRSCCKRHYIHYSRDSQTWLYQGPTGMMSLSQGPPAKQNLSLPH